jgi:CheY-like chemotaxis protein
MPQPAPPTALAEPAELEPPTEEELIGMPKTKMPDYSGKCKAILAGSKMLDLVMIADNNANIVAKAARKTLQSSLRKIAPDELIKTVLRAHIAKGAFDVNAAQTGKASSIRVQYNAMDVILYPLENNLTLLVIGLIEPAALDEVYDLIASEFPSKQKMAMIVDDEEDIRKSIEQVLIKRGFKVETADSGWRALEVIKNAKEKGLEYGVAILDIRMPGMDGFELFKRISQVSPNTKMLFITAFEYSQEDVARMVSAGNIKLLRKPFKRADLLQFITDETSARDASA